MSVSQPLKATPWHLLLVTQRPSIPRNIYESETVSETIIKYESLFTAHMTGAEDQLGRGIPWLKPQVDLGSIGVTSVRKQVFRGKGTRRALSEDGINGQICTSFKLHS